MVWFKEMYSCMGFVAVSLSSVVHVKFMPQTLKSSCLKPNLQWLSVHNVIIKIGHQLKTSYRLSMDQGVRRSQERSKFYTKKFWRDIFFLCSYIIEFEYTFSFRLCCPPYQSVVAPEQRARRKQGPGGGLRLDPGGDLERDGEAVL